MASTNQTANYKLSQYIGSDKPTYLGDYNSDMLKIDTQMKKNADDIQENKEQTTIIGTTADTALANANNAQTTANEANATATEGLSKANTNEADLSIIKNKSIITIVPNGDNFSYLSDKEYDEIKISQWKIKSSKGNNITFNTENNNYVIGKGVKQVKVSSNIELTNISSNTTIGAIIIKNSNNEKIYTAETYTYTSTSGFHSDTLSLSPYLVDVQEGDLIDIRISFEKAGQSAQVKRQSYFTIEEV